MTRPLGHEPFVAAARPKGDDPRRRAIAVRHNQFFTVTPALKRPR
jgi:hypothetical protein